jgi:hypothetical protein
MRNLVLLFVALLIVVPVVASAAAPAVGTYKTLNGQVLTGRATESMPSDLPTGEGALGNLIMAASWNGTTLGTNWAVSCPQIASAPVLTFDDVDEFGYGQRIWRTDYTGGRLWLSGTGAWAGGDPYYTSSLSTFRIIVTKQYAAGAIVGAVSNINLRGPIDGYSSCFEMAISNAELVGYTPYPAPGIFPAIKGPSDCDATGSHATYWDVHDVTLTLYGSCVVPTEKSTWGAIKTLYR